MRLKIEKVNGLAPKVVGDMSSRQISSNVSATESP